ncbi:hypothetical protein GGX14DRAFT_520357 [Mycena pura]|uniref:Uncharacterized protein n=1 Tax=Mycena pura TaxID=153505 RepID=A0AAD6YAW1_9AGAR|nr:hypothetical protein GGX14DRAFT_520357 [Mycena pura]
MGKRKHTTRKRTSTTQNPRAGKRARTSQDSENHNPDSPPRSSQSPGPDGPSHSPSQVPELNEDMSSQELYQASRQLQSQLNELRQSQQEAGRNALANITNQSDGGSDEEPSGEEPDGKFVLCKGKQFCYTNLLFLPDEDACFTTGLDESYNDLERFETEENRVQGALRELREFIPEEYHALEEWNGWVRHDLVKGMNDQRSVFANRMRGNPGWFGRSVGDFAPTGREAWVDLVGRKPDPENRGKYYYDTFDVPLLHAEYDGALDLDKVFLNEHLFTAHAGLTRGPSGARQLLTGKAAPKKMPVLEKLWGLKKTTPGMIASAAVYVRWAHSRDEEFGPVGDVTGIEWWKDFNAYLEYLKTGLAEKSDCVENIFRGTPNSIQTPLKARWAMGTTRTQPRTAGPQRWMP